jgi:hypothetical protein
LGLPDLAVDEDVTREGAVDEIMQGQGMRRMRERRNSAHASPRLDRGGAGGRETEERLFLRRYYVMLSEHARRDRNKTGLDSQKKRHENHAVQPTEVVIWMFMVWL